MYSILEIHDRNLSSHITASILQGLPQWFGIPEANQEYIQAVKDQYFLALYHKGEAVGLLSIKVHNPYTAEIYLLGILRGHQGKGMGRLLLERAQDHLRVEGYRYLMVKTLGPSRDDPYYQKTRKIYLQLGFYPLEELKGLWGPHNPCLLLIKNL